MVWRHPEAPRLILKFPSVAGVAECRCQAVRSNSGLSRGHRQRIDEVLVALRKYGTGLSSADGSPESIE